MRTATASDGRSGTAWRCLSCLCAGSAADWPGAEPILAPEIVRLAREHRLAARAGARIGTERFPVPAELERPLVRRHREVLGERALFDRALERLDRIAEREGVAVVLLKGADLARRLYGPGERPHNDLDLLVAPRDAQRFWEVLAAGGFRPEGPPPSRSAWFATPLRSAAHARVQIDLHWQLGTPGRTRWDVEALIARARPVEGSRALHRLAPDDLAVHLAVHAVSFHGAAGRRIWWLDLHLLRRQLADPATRRRAAAVGGRTCVEAAALRAAELFGGTAAGTISARARLVARLGARFEGGSGGRARRWLVAALAVDRAGDLARAAAHVSRRALRARRPAPPRAGAG